MVECELWYKKIIQGEYTVLIDTWWNVNCIARSSNLYRRFVLIDTWWNVNQEYPYFNLTGVSVLIDTWWNVNSFVCTLALSGVIRFNRYIVA